MNKHLREVKARKAPSDLRLQLADPYEVMPRYPDDNGLVPPAMLTHIKRLVRQSTWGGKSLM